MTNQPTWKLVYATDYSALYVDTTGVYDPELAIAQECDDAPASERVQVYRFPLERCYMATRGDDGGAFLCSMDPERASVLPYALTSYVPWFAKSLGKIASFVGSTVADLQSALCSEDPDTRAEAYEAIGGYHGYDNFDSYPETWTEHAFESWPERGTDFGPMEIRLSCSDDDDGMVTVYCDDQEACKRDQSISLDGQSSRWECPRDMDIGYTSLLNCYDLDAALTAAGYVVDSSEYSPPDAEDLAYWAYKHKCENTGEECLDRDAWLDHNDATEGK